MEDIPVAKPSSMEPKFISQLKSSGNDMETFLKTSVNPDQRELVRCHEIVDNLVRFLHRSKYSVSKVVKGGSLGKGTSTKIKSDIDLVVFLNDYRTVAALQTKMKEVLEYFMRYIKQDARWASQVEFSEPPNDWMITFKLKCHSYDHLHDVDLLPACDLSQESESSIYSRMKGLSQYNRTFYSVSFGQQQIDFVETRPARLKDLIRLVKHWRTVEKLKIKSYCLELVIVKNWMDWGRPERFNLKERFKTILTVLSNFSTIHITWPPVFDIPSDGPVVMDPSNPFNNPGGDILRTPGALQNLEKKAAQTLEHL